MTKVVRVVGGAVGIAVSFIPGMGWLQVPSIALLLGGAQEYLTKKPRISDPGDPFRDLTVNISDPVGALPVIYGDMNVGVHRVWARTENETVDGTLNRNRFLYILCAVCHGPVKDFPAIIIDGRVALIRSSTDPSRYFTLNYFDLVHAQWASGTDGQQAVIPKSDSRTITSIARTGANEVLHCTTSTAHNFAQGDVLRVTGNSIGGYNLPGGYTVQQVTGPTTLDIWPRTGQPTGTGTGGTIDYYNMDPTALANGIGPAWSAAKMGKGVAYLLVRLRFDETYFSGVPRIEVAVEGRTIKDTRSVTTLTISSTASAPARTGYSSTVDVTFSAAHGRAVGDQLLIAGHSAAYLNGFQRVDEVVSSTVARIYTPYSAGSGGTAEVMPFSTNPAMIVRDYLTSSRYGAAVPAAELDETALQTEANYCDESVLSKFPQTTRKDVTATTTTNPAQITTQAAHGFVTGHTVRIWNHPQAPFNGLWTVTVIDPTTFSIPYDNTSGTTTFAGARVQRYQNAARYRTSGVLSPAESLKTNLEKLMTSYRASMVYQAGIYRTWTRRVAYPGAFELTPQNIIPGTFRFHRPGLNEMANRMRAAYYLVYRQAVGNFEVTTGRADFIEWPTAVGYTNPELTTEDNGFESLHEIDLPCATDGFIAEQIAQIVRAESRTGLIVGVTAKLDALQLAVGDLVPVTHDTPQWNRKKFWVMNITIQPEGLVNLVLLEYSAAAYTTKWYPDET